MLSKFENEDDNVSIYAIMRRVRLTTDAEGKN
jgi:hypothetical protein